MGETQGIESSRERAHVANELEGVAGWLLFLCIALVILAPLVEFYSLQQEWSAASDHPELQNIVITETCFGVLLTLWGMGAGVNLWIRSAGAVYVACLYFIALIVGSAFLPVVIGFEIDDAGVIAPRAGYASQAITPIVSAAIWLIYLARSRRVRATYGLPSRLAHERRSFRERSKLWLPLERIAFVAFALGAATSVVIAGALAFSDSDPWIESVRESHSQQVPLPSRAEFAALAKRLPPGAKSFTFQDGATNYEGYFDEKCEAKSDAARIKEAEDSCYANAFLHGGIGSNWVGGVDVCKAPSLLSSARPSKYELPESKCILAEFFDERTVSSQVFAWHFDRLLGDDLFQAAAVMTLAGLLVFFLFRPVWLPFRRWVREG